MYDNYAFEAVAVVPINHTNGLEGLRGGVYCHPGLDETDLRWSPRVLKTLEQMAARTDRCQDVNTAGKTAEEMEVDTLNNFFSAACRPGTWSYNETVDANLKSRYSSLCDRCGNNAGCTRYTLDMGVSVAGVRNDNRHIQALECLRVNGNSTSTAVAYVAWQHLRNPNDAPSYAVLCPNGTLAPLTTDTLNNAIAPCAFVRQPWGTIVASTDSSAAILLELRNAWPAGSSPSGNSWQSTLFTMLAGGANAKVVYQDAPTTPLDYTSPIRSISNADASASCMPARRWCTISEAEMNKCSWVRAAAHTLGMYPACYNLPEKEHHLGLPLRCQG
ncbi:hypothetical protein HW555_006055 [Spodoptera exigua]|uniref:Transferrin n=1 Tax=Spodoptera exigua TaxID=7107 RepID=A0A835L6T7_SPOEX|nr:hypothetical protein HW555_006055 [Spodoptera exigua]